MKLSKKTPSINGDQLLEAYVSAMVNLTTAKTAEYMAGQSEDEAIRNIKAAAQSNLAHQDLPSLPHELVKSSLRAHAQKAQSTEINNLTSSQLRQMEAEIKHNYKRKKIQITILEPAKKPVETISFNNRTGQHHNGFITAKRITGVFDDASLVNNVLVLTPTNTTKLILPSRKYIVVYVVNPETLQAMVSLKVL